MKQQTKSELDRLFARTLLVGCLCRKDGTSQPSSVSLEFWLFAFCNQRLYELCMTNENSDMV
jgi:hypothetical protein